MALKVLLAVCLSVLGRGHGDGWQYLLENRPEQARVVFQRLLTEGDDYQVGEACRGLSEVAAFLGEQDAATKYYFNSYLKDGDRLLFLAGCLRQFYFSSSATGFKLREGYKALLSLAKQRSLFQGQFQDALVQRYINDGDLNKAARLTRTMGSLLKWKFIGPFNNISNAGYHTVYPPEMEIDFTKTYSGKDANLAQWHNLSHRGQSGWIFLNNHTTSYDAVYYFYCSLQSDCARDILLLFGSSSVFKIFLNGRLVLADSVFRNTGVDSYIQQVRLQKGGNPLLVKVGHEKGFRQPGSEARSNFHLRMLGMDYARPSGITVSLAPVKAFGNTAPVARLKPSPMADSVISTLKRRMANPEHELETALLLLRFYLAMEYTDEAEILAEKYLDNYPTSALLHGLYTEALFRGGKRVAGQVSLRKAYRFCRKYAYAWGNELGITESYGDAKKTIAFIKQSDDHLKGSSTALLSLLRASLQLDQKATAMVLFRQLESGHGLSEQVVKVLASFYTEQGKTAKLESVLKRFLAHNRSNADFYQLMAEAAVRQGRIARAIKHYRDCIRYSPNNPNNYYYLADLHFMHKQSEKALTFIEECLKLAPASAIALNLKANILISLDKKVEAKAVLRNIIRFTKDDFNAWDHLRELNDKPSLEAMAPLPRVDSLIREAQSWTPLSHKTGAILVRMSDVFRYPSRCSSLRHFMAVYLPTQQAIDIWKEQHFSYNANFQVLTVNKAVSLKAGGMEIPADILHGQAVFKSLEPGDVILMEWTIKNYYQGKMANHVYGSESFQLTTPAYFSCLRLVTPVNDTIPFQVYGDSIRSTTHLFGDYRVRALSRGPYRAPPEESHMATAYRDHQNVVYSTFKGWESIADWYLGLTGGKQVSALEISRLANSLFTGAPQPGIKVARVHDFITGNIRYSYVPFRQSGWVPQSAKDVLATRIGDCKDMANLAKILLEKGGISCDLVLVNTAARYFHDHAFIGPNFNHCIIDYTINGVRRFLDFTDNNLSYGSLPKSNQGAMALVVKKGSNNLITLPVDTPGQRVKSRKVISRLREDGSLECRMHSVRTGVFAGDFRYFLRFKSREEQSRHIHKVLSASYPDMSLKDFQFDNLDNLTDTLRYEYEYLARNSVTFSGRTAIFPLEMPDVLSAGSFPVEEKRSYPVDMHMAWFDVSSLLLEGELIFPEKWRLIDLPPEVVLKSNYGSYHLSFRINGNKIVYRRHGVFNCRNLVPVSDYPELSSFLKKISKSDAVHLVFFTR